MSSTIDLKMDSQEVAGSPTAAAERRETSIVQTDEAKPTPREGATAASTVEAPRKCNGTMECKKKNPQKIKKNAKKVKFSKSKATDDDSSSSSSEEDDDELADLSSESPGSDSNSEAIACLKSKKSNGKKTRKEAEKGAKKATTKAKKHKKGSLESDKTSSDSDDAEDIDGSVGDNDRKATAQKQENDLLKLRIQQLQHQLAVMAAAPPVTSNGVFNATGNMGLGNHGSGITSNNAFGYPGGGFGNLTSNQIHNLAAKRQNVRDYDHRSPDSYQKSSRLTGDGSYTIDEIMNPGAIPGSKAKAKVRGQKKPVVQRMDFKRVDQVWDSQLHNYKLQDTAETASNSRYDEFLFHVRRTFDWEGKYKATVVDIKSKPLRETLKEVMGSIKGISLVEDTPKVDPNTLFLYLEDMRRHVKVLGEAEPEGETRKERKLAQKEIDEKRRHLKVLVKYLDFDYAQIKKTLNPMLENGLITFDLLWALWKPNTLAYTPTYGSVDQPRVFKVEMAQKIWSMLKGEYYHVEGKYLEFDGKQFGYGSMREEVGEFHGARKITSLGCYPLKYHKHETQLREQLIERGKKFVTLGGMNYKAHQGMAFTRKKKSVIKVNINGRIMIDPALFRRINPNYALSLVRPKDEDSDDEDSEDDDCCCEGDSDDEGSGFPEEALEQRERGSKEKTKFVTKIFKDPEGKIHAARIPKEMTKNDNQEEKLGEVPSRQEVENKTGNATPQKNGDVLADEASGDEDDEKAETATIPDFTDEEYLIASPVVIGFSFSEKLWLEFTVSGVKEIAWNENAYESLVMEPKTKDIVRALVESHKYHPTKSVDDVIQGKGKGLVAVLHGPPGTGKTLTAEGISELLRCPLYMVSAGDLGTDSRYLEAELQKILDICHAWGAILLLDEADVFLEKRNMQDIHRNALVSIFLRQLEYFQGILFLTTNRVETFDDAFQSRIHIALRYDELDARAKKAVFKMFVERARRVAGVELTPFSEDDYAELSRHALNGRQIKNTVGTAQALAVQKREPLGMKHICQVLEVQQKFDRDLKGGPGYQDALRSYY